MDEIFELDEDMDAIVEALGNAIEQEESEPQVLNVPRMLLMVRAYKLIRQIAWDSWKITSAVHKPYTSMGVITIEAEEFTFDRLSVLQEVLSGASNVEIFPLTNGNLKMNITFHGITKRME